MRRFSVILLIVFPLLLFVLGVPMDQVLALLLVSAGVLITCLPSSLDRKGERRLWQALADDPPDPGEPLEHVAERCDRYAKSMLRDPRLSRRPAETAKVYLLRFYFERLFAWPRELYEQFLGNRTPPDEAARWTERRMRERYDRLCQAGITLPFPTSAMEDVKALGDTV